MQIKKELPFQKSKIHFSKELLLCMMLTFFLSGLRAQQLSCEAEPLNSVLTDIEKRTDLTFNYDPELLSPYLITGNFELSEPRILVESLLKETPLEFERNDLYILIYLPDKKTYSLCGYIKNKNDNVAVPFANIYVEDSNKGTESNADGYFYLNIEAHKNESISISSMGFKTTTFRVNEWPEEDCIDIHLQQNTYSFDLGLIVVSYLLEGISEGADYGSINLNSDELTKKYSFQEQDILKTVQLLPGITSIDESATNLSIRGSLPSQNLVLWEGVTLYDPGHLFGLISSINPFVVKRVDAYKSVYNSRYENRVGGIVDISLTDEISNHYKGGIGTTLTESHGYTHAPVIKDKLSILLSGRLTTNKIATSPTLDNYSDKIFQTTIIGEEGASTPIGFNNEDERLNFYDWNAKILFKPIEKVFLEASYFRSKNKFSYFAMASGDDFESNESVLFNSEALGTRMTIDWANQLSSELFFNKSKYQSENQTLFSNNSESGFSYETYTLNNIDDTQLGIINHLHLKSYFDFDLGYFYKDLKVDYTLDRSSVSDIDYSGTKNTIGRLQSLMASLSFEKERLSLMAGLRSTYYNELKDWFFSPRMYLQFLLNDHVKLKCSAGQFYQFINQRTNIGNSTINANSGLWVLSDNESGEALNAHKVSAGLIFKYKSWLLDLEGYFHKTKGISSISTSLIQEQEGTGKSQVIGLDVLVKKNWKNYRLWLNYTINQNLYSFPQIASSAFPANNDHRHNLSFYNNYQWKKWNFSLTWQFRTGLPYSIPIGTEQYIPDGQQNTFYRLSFDQINSSRLDYYSRMDVGVTYKTPILKEKMNLEIGGSLLNVLNRKNIFSRDYFIGDVESSEELKVISIEKFQLRRTPQLLLRFYW